jgi:hypothetical protein
LAVAENWPRILFKVCCFVLLNCESHTVVLHALSEHFRRTSADDSRSSAERAKYEGLQEILEPSTFFENLGLLLDTLLELSELSLELQNRKYTLYKVQTEIQKTLKGLEFQKEKPGTFYSDVQKASTEKTFIGISLS